MGVKLQQRVTRTRANGCKLLEFRWFRWSLWIRRVLVRAQERQLKARSELGFGRVSSFLEAGVSWGVSFSPSNPNSYLRNQEATERAPSRRTRLAGAFAITASKVRSSVCW